jgi:uncharacterized protein with ParB-like and HNH nuclease domain
MSYKPISLSNLIIEKNRSLFLPHIQRPFVWEIDQITRLMDSLMRNYPIQTLLFWKTADHIKSRKFMDSIDYDADLSDFYDYSISQENMVKTLVLDGQQRLQSLFSIYDGYIDNNELYINLLTGNKELEDGLFYEFQLSKVGTRLELPYFKLKEIVHDNRNAEDIADDINDKLENILKGEEDRRERERFVRRNISQIVSLVREDKHFWVEELDGIALKYTYSNILNIFVRVNSGGTKLDAADLMFAAMKEAWEDIEEKIEDIVDMLNNSGKMKFDKAMVLRSLMLITDKGASLNPDLFVGEKGEKNLQDIRNIWPDDGTDKVLPAFQQLRDFIYNDLVLYSDKVVRSYNSFIPIFEYFFLHPNPDPINRGLLKSYYYKSQLFN